MGSDETRTREELSASGSDSRTLTDLSVPLDNSRTTLELSVVSDCRLHQLRPMNGLHGHLGQEVVCSEKAGEKFRQGRTRHPKCCIYFHLVLFPCCSNLWVTSRNVSQCVALYFHPGCSQCFVTQPDKLQTLKDYRLTIEYKHLKQNAPGGVFVIPSVNHLRIWYGVIFVRRGHYANGIFKFRWARSEVEYMYGVCLGFAHRYIRLPLLASIPSFLHLAPI